MSAPVGRPGAHPNAAAGAAQPGTVAPQLDRGRAILWLGGSLIAVVYLTRNHITPAALVNNQWDTSTNLPGAAGLIDAALEAAMLGVLYLLSRLSDLAGTAAIVFLVAVWLAFLYSHASPIEAFIGKGGQATVATDKTVPKPTTGAQGGSQ